MKKAILYIGIVAAIIGCTKSEEFTNTTDERITFNAVTITSRVTDDGNALSWEVDDQVTITTTDGSKTGIYTITSVTTGDMSHYSGDVLCTNAGINSTEQTFLSWHPATLNLVDSVFALDLSEQSTVEQFVFGSVTTSTSEATIIFDPIYTKLVFNLTAGGVDVSDLTGATATLTGANTKGDYNYSTVVFSNLSSSTLSPELVVSSDVATASVTIYVLETEVENSSLIINVGGEHFITSLAGKSWVKGNMYEYDVTVGDKVPDMYFTYIDKTYIVESITATKSN
ncbi:MAG: fimbrillin family protein [Rikenellaceae bacterium]